MSSSPPQPAYDVFLSHDPADGAVVEKIAEHLSGQQFHVWLDAWELAPGVPHEAEVDDAVARSRVFAACIGSHRAAWAERELALARDARATRGDLQLLAVLLPGATADSLPADLAEAPSIDLTDGATVEAMAPLVEAISAARRRSADAAPEPDEAAPLGFSRSDHAKVIADADEALAEDPSDVQALQRRQVARQALGRYDEALADVDRLLELEPENLGTYTQKVGILLKLGQTDEVPEVVQLLEDRAPQLADEMAEVYSGLDAEEIEAIGKDFSVALEGTSRYAFVRLVAALRDDRDLAIGRIRAEAAILGARAAAKPEKALEYWGRAVEFDPESATAAIGLITAVGQSGGGEAMRRLAAELEEREDSPAALAALALERLSRGEAQDALGLLDRGVALDETNPTLRLLRSSLLIGLERLEDAAADLRVVLDDNPSNWKILTQLMALYRRLGRLDDVADLMDIMADNIEPALRSLLHKPGGEEAVLASLAQRANLEAVQAQHRVMAANTRAKARWEQSKRREALELAFATVRRWPAEYAAWASALELLAKAPELGEMETEDVEPPWVGPLWQACRVWVRGDLQEAGGLITAAIEDNADLADRGIAFFLRGAAAADAGDLRAALEDFDRVAEIDPEAPAPRTARANVRATLGQLAEALDDYDFVIDEKAAASEGEVYFRRGEVRRQLGRYREAIEDFDAALRLPWATPDFGPIVVASRGQAKLGLADLDGALGDLDAALARAPELDWALASRALLHLARQDVSAAIADRKAYVALRPDDASGWELYGQLLLETGQAETLWTELAGRLDEIAKPSLNLLAMLGRAAIDTGHHEEGEEIFREAAAAAPEEDWYVYEQARALRHLGRAEEAAGLVDTALERLQARSFEPGDQLATSFNRCLYLLAAGRDDEARRANADLLDDLDDPDAARVALRELDELRASGHRSEAATSIRAEVQAWLDASTATGTTTATA